MRKLISLILISNIALVSLPVYAQDASGNIFKTLIDQRAEYANAQLGIAELTEKMNTEMANIRSNYNKKGHLEVSITLLMIWTLIKGTIGGAKATQGGNPDLRSFVVEGILIAAAYGTSFYLANKNVNDKMVTIKSLQAEMLKKSELINQNISQLDKKIEKLFALSAPATSEATKAKRENVLNLVKELSLKLKQTEAQIKMIETVVSELDDKVNWDMTQEYVKVSLVTLLTIVAVTSNAVTTKSGSKLEIAAIIAGLIGYFGSAGYSGVWMAADSYIGAARVPVNDFKKIRDELQADLERINDEYQTVIGQLD
ncbi:MAG: hypothetical protein JNM93_11785 [Bacteriovoracaceae bacterium]|nr:hypothetical protein [Bacteriovoracaceae bacterium]